MQVCARARTLELCKSNTALPAPGLMDCVASLVVGRLCDLAGASEAGPLAFFGVPGDYRCAPPTRGRVCCLKRAAARERRGACVGEQPIRRREKHRCEAVPTLFSLAHTHSRSFGTLDAILREPRARWHGCASELNAGYAADGYARVSVSKRITFRITLTPILRSARWPCW